MVCFHNIYIIRVKDVSSEGKNNEGECYSGRCAPQHKRAEAIRVDIIGFVIVVCIFRTTNALRVMQLRLCTPTHILRID